MLKSLLIKNFILIEDKTLNFSKGFNILCGETGAGKSIIIKALDCVLGAKITKEMFLNKEKPVVIEAVFVEKEDEITVSRETLNSSKYRLNGILTSLDEIKTLKDKLVDIHSQYQTYSYIQSKNHICLLDDYISKKSPEFLELLKCYKKIYLEFKAIEKKLNQLKENSGNNEREIDFLKFSLHELDEAAVEADEEEELKKELDILSNAQELKEGAYSSYWALYGDGENILEALSKIRCSISSLAELDEELDEVKNVLFDSIENLKDSANFLRDYASNLEYNPERLDEINERISLIQKLKRKYGSNLDLEREKIEKRLNELTDGDNNIEEIEKKYDDLLNSINLLAKNLEEYRINNASELALLIEEKLKNLELKEAKFEISIKNSPLSDLGKNTVEFLISTNKNQIPMTLSKVASGGEISRVMLALKTIFSGIDKISTVVFDEIDTGISGITSVSVAETMLELAQNTQIITISHQPIICAKANNFIWIEKEHNKEKTNIKISYLNDDKRLHALAQLAGGEISEQTVEFAKTLM